MKKICISGLFFLAALTGVKSQGFLNTLKKDIKKEEQLLNQNASQNTNSNGQRWMKINFGNEIPSNAVIGGKDGDGSPLFVARANYGGNWHPGKTRRIGTRPASNTEARN